MTLRAQVRTETNQLMTLNAIADAGNAKRRRAEMRMLRLSAARRLRTQKAMLRSGPPNAETDVEAELNKGAQQSNSRAVLLKL